LLKRLSHLKYIQSKINYLLEFIEQVLKKLLIEVLTTQHGISVGGLHFEDTTIDLKNRDIESTTTYTIDKR